MTLSADQRPEHVPLGNPCAKCGQHASRHRVYHKPQGEPCRVCGLSFNNHRTGRSEDYQAKKARNATRYRPGQKSVYRPRKTVYLGIDGEGQGRREHKYIFLAASTEDGRHKWSVENSEGLSTIQCLDFILRLPTDHHKVFAYAFSYDLTKILQDVDNETLYKLFRPELRQRPAAEAMKGPYYVHWNGYALNYQGSKFTVSKGRKRVVIWDIFKFFQSKFVGALKDWKVGNDELWTRMQAMKDQRGEFDKLNFEEVKAYCFEECACMAELARKLTEAHVSAGLKLQSYYGAGSSASAMLNVMGIKEKITKNYPPEMRTPIASAFFGGRFENSAIGPIEGTVWNYDISSAYPYQLYWLPCLEHGVWQFTTNREDLERSDVKASLVNYRLEPSAKLRKENPNFNAWGPFPFRTRDGSICFPIESGGGWVYHEEFKTGERLFPYVRFKGAWVYSCQCDCRPFKRIPEYYCERCAIGKEGPGIVIKLGCNSCYGKLAQSVGNAVFNSWLWAGLITSGTRAQLLELLGLHTNWSNALMMATDGLATRERLVTPVAKETGTDKDIIERPTGKVVRKPLGGWEEKEVKKGMFLARPGVYFPMSPTSKELKDVRGRGVGKGVVLENWQRIVNAWPVANIDDTVAVSNVSRFCGAKSSIHRSGKIGEYRYSRSRGEDSKPAYGEWIVRKVEMSFNPMPKRAKVNPDGVTLKLRRLPWDVESTPYDRCALSEEARELRAVSDECLEQPDGDLAEYL